MNGRQFLIIITLFLTACSADNQASTSASVSTSDRSTSNIDTSRQIQKTVQLDYNFKIEVGQNEDFGNFETFTYFILSHNDKQLYRDTSFTEYEFGDTLYPIVRNTDNGTFEILVEVNDRPNKNYLKYFRVHQDKIVSIQKLPTFISAATNLDTDKNLEYAGFWDYGEVYGDSGELTVYNPIIYYELTSTGLTLDSTLTIERNKTIYGAFHGFVYSEKVEIKTKESKMDQEIKRIAQTKR